MDEIRTFVANIPDGFLTAFILFLLLAGPRFFARIGLPGVVGYGNSNKWSQPWFCNIASAGLQIGADVSEVIALVMTDAGMEAVKKSEPMDAQVSPIGGADTSGKVDLLAFVRQTEGAGAGKSLSGVYFSPADGLNNAYYGKVVTSRAVFDRKEVYNRDASKLVSLVSRYGKVRRR